MKIKHYANWLWRGKFHFLSLASIAAAILYLTKVVEFYPNEISLGMALFGLLIIFVQQVLDAQEYADHRPNTPLNWLKSWPRKRTLSGGLFDVSSETKDKARAKLLASPDLPLDQKVDFLLKQVDLLSDSIANVDDRVDKVESNLKANQESIHNQIGKLSDSMKTIMAGHVVGSYDVNLFGIILTLSGTLIQFFSAPNPAP